MNRAEMILLICLCVVTVAGIRPVEQYAPYAVSVILSLMIVIPIPVVLCLTMVTVQEALRSPSGHTPVEMSSDDDSAGGPDTQMTEVPPSLLEQGTESSDTVLDRQQPSSSLIEVPILSSNEPEMSATDL